MIINGVELKKPLAKYIDHTLLKADATPEQIIKLCKEALEHDFASVCVNSCYAPLVAEQLKGSNVKTCCVVGFPLGAMLSSCKAEEARAAIAAGATEIDMVINVGLLKAKNYEAVQKDIEAVVAATKDKALLKVIIETCLLTDEEKKLACQLSVKAGAQYVKTSTGFSTGGATAEDIALMRATVGPDIGVKASGGVRDLAGALAMIHAGASRIGASAGMKILTEAEKA